MTTGVSPKFSSRTKKQLGRVTIRFAGDSGDGIQITGGQFTNTTAIAGNDLSTLPDFPAEIRAPAGTLPGVSGFQIQFASVDIHTPGDQPDVLVAFNPAALKVNLGTLRLGTTIIVNTDAFQEVDLKKAGYDRNPLENGILDKFKVFKVPITTLTLRVLESVDLTHKEKERCKNFFALGLMYWLYNRSMDTTIGYIRDKFKKDERLVEANEKVLRAGWNFGETCEFFNEQYEVSPATYRPGTYRNISGNVALAVGLVAASKQSGLPLVYVGYPITPASDILHELARFKNFGVVTVQAEDEIAAATAAIGASFTGALGVTGSSGPGISLKTEAVNLAVMTELPLVICDVQRAGPSTGMPTKTEQSDLLLAMFGRNAESPVAIVAPATPGECFTIALEAARIAIKYMTPVYVLSDTFLANGAEPWLIPRPEELPKIEVAFRTDPKEFYPYLRDPKTLARPWVKPGTPALEHRIGGLEKSEVFGNVSYDPDNHDTMVKLRAEKIARIAQDIPPVSVEGKEDARLLVLGWGSTYGVIRAAVEECLTEGIPVAHAHLRHLNPFPANLGQVLGHYERVLVPENNMGQLRLLLRSRYLMDVAGYNRITGQPFKVVELVEAIKREMETI